MHVAVLPVSSPYPGGKKAAVSISSRLRLAQRQQGVDHASDAFAMHGPQMMFFNGRTRSEQQGLAPARARTNRGLYCPHFSSAGQADDPIKMP